MLRILIADDHEMIRGGLKSLLEAHEGWEVCGEAATGREAVQRCIALKPDIVVMDISMPDLNGLEATRRIRKECPKTEILVLTMHDSEQLVREVMRAGARSYILKGDAGTVLTAAVESLARHKPFFSSRVSEIILQDYLEGETAASETDIVGGLTPREREVLQLIAEGKSSKEIASVLNISTKTSETHRSNLMRKLDLHSVSELVRYAIRNKIIDA